MPYFSAFELGKALSESLIYMVGHSHKEPDKSKPVFGICDHVRFNLAFLATETN